MASSDLRVVIIGAGSTGLLLAQGLKQRGIKAEIYEREDTTTYQDRPREWGMTLHWGTSFIKTCLPPEMCAALSKNVCTDPSHAEKDMIVTHYHGQTGEKLAEIPGEQPRRVSRKKLRNFLSQGIDVKYGKKLQSIEIVNDEAFARFTDGSSASGTCIIGCDGTNSRVRTCLVGEEAGKASDIDVQMINISVSLPRELSLALRNIGNPIMHNSFHPDGFMFWQSVQNIEDFDKPETWLWQNIFSWKGAPRPEDFPDSASRLKFWREKTATCVDPWRSTVLALPDDIQFGVDKTKVWRPFDWSDMPLAGKVTLAGDAAHTMPPFRGQGLNNALEDAARLVEQLDAVKQGTKSLANAIKEFEDETRERALIEIPISVMQAKTVHDFDKLMQAPMFRHGIGKLTEKHAQEAREAELRGSY